MAGETPGRQIPATVELVVAGFFPTFGDMGADRAGRGIRLAGRPHGVGACEFAGHVLELDLRADGGLAGACRLHAPIRAVGLEDARLHVVARTLYSKFLRLERRLSRPAHPKDSHLLSHDHE